MPDTKQSPDGPASAPADTTEPLDAILAEMRGRILGEDRIKYTLSAGEALAFADRIEAAAKREREINQKILVAANDANAILKDGRDRAIQFANAAPHPGSVSWKEMHEVYAKARAILSAVPKVDNAAAMREALLACAKRLGIHVVNFKTGVVPPSAEDEAEKDENAHSLAFAALAAPARNCDRFDNYLDARAEYDGNLGSEEWRFGAWLFATAEGKERPDA